MSLNRTVIVGRLTRDLELRTTNTGKQVLEFSVACDKRIKPTDPNQPTADFFRCKVWGQGAEFLSKYGGKGRLVAVDGRLESRRYLDKDGNQRDVVEIVADNVSLLDSKKEEPQPEGYTQTPRSQGGAGYRPNPSTPQTPAGGADEYDPYADE